METEIEADLKWTIYIYLYIISFFTISLKIINYN